MSRSAVCPACGACSSRPRRRIPSPFVAHDYRLYACGSCGSAFFDANEHPVDLAAVYDRHALDKADEYPETFQPSPYWRSEVSRLRRLHSASVHTLLDVGCRTGDFLLHWPESVNRTGVELARGAAETARRRGLDVIQGPVETSLPESAFDVVSCYAILEHLRDTALGLRQLAARVAPGGVLAIMVPTRQCLKHALLWNLHCSWHMYSPPQHLCFPSRRFLDTALLKLGLTLSYRRYTSGGMFNPLRRIPRLNAWSDRLMMALDHHSPLGSVPIFDHMYGYYTRSLGSEPESAG